MGAIEGKDVLVECGMLRLSSSARVQAGEVSLPPGGLEQARGSVLCAKISMGSDNPFANDERLKDALESGVAETAGNAAETNTVMAPTAHPRQRLNPIKKRTKMQTKAQVNLRRILPTFARYRKSRRPRQCSRSAASRSSPCLRARASKTSDRSLGCNRTPERVRVYGFSRG